MEKHYQKEIDKRRTFGIISHPDAGKTTLTEKILLFGGAIQLAGTVKSKKASRHATSDWMAIEKERGISVTTSVMKIQYQDYEVNLLDTPGHQDFSEDTYRVLTAVDSALVVIDGAKGVEAQTKKLMDVCRMRKTPIMVFVNKLDRECLEPLALLEDIEEHLQVEAVPFTWPVGMGKEFRGTYHLYERYINVFDGSHNDRIQEGIRIDDLQNSQLDELLESQAQDLRDDVELLEGAANPFSAEAYLAGQQAPVFFGSAINNFGVQELLDTFLKLAPPPQPRQATTREVDPYEKPFSGVVFKIQANMDPAHRDRIAFLRICSGKFERGMKMRHHRIAKDITVSNATIFMAQDRSHVEDAYAGDIIGIHNHGTIKIGDTFTDKESLKFIGIPHFAPEHFQVIRIKNALKSKQMEKGLTQLAEEGAVQCFRPFKNNEIILGAVGVLQFDVIAERLKNEYGVDATYQACPLNTVRWVRCDDPQMLASFEKKNQQELALDAANNLSYLANSAWQLQRVVELWPDITFSSTIEHC